LVKNEEPELESEKERLTIEGAESKKQLQEIEDKILEILARDKKELLEDETALNVLTASKTKSNSINEQQKISEVTE